MTVAVSTAADCAAEPQPDNVASPETPAALAMRRNFRRVKNEKGAEGVAGLPAGSPGSRAARTLACDFDSGTTDTNCSQQPVVSRPSSQGGSLASPRQRIGLLPPTHLRPP
jgi:hypothetical protein